jgi:hypothetical protein
LPAKAVKAFDDAGIASSANFSDSAPLWLRVKGDAKALALVHGG